MGPFFLIGCDHVRSAEGIHVPPRRRGLEQKSVSTSCPTRTVSRRKIFHAARHVQLRRLHARDWNMGLLVLYYPNGRVKAPHAALLGLSPEALAVKQPYETKDLLIDLTRRELPRVMGDLYAEVVVNCLTCPDEDNLDFADEGEFDDADSVAVGVRYIEKILPGLYDISV